MMFTKSQLLAAAAVVSSASLAMALPLYNDINEIEARSNGRDALTELKRRVIMEYLQDLEARTPGSKDEGPYGANGGWINPLPGSKRPSKIRQTSEVLAVGKHKENEPGHHAVAPGNTAHVHDSFHKNNGPNHATVEYKTPEGHHATTLHIAKDGTRLAHNQEPPTHRGGASPPPNSPASHSSSRASSPSKGKRELDLLELIARELEWYDDLD